MKPGKAPCPGWGGKRAGAGRPRKSEQRRTVEQVVLSETEHVLVEIRTVGPTEALVRELGLQSLATLLEATRRGNLKAAIFLLDRVLGAAPEPSTAEKLADCSRETVIAFLEERIATAGLSPKASRELVAALAASIDAELEEPSAEANDASTLSPG